MPAPTSSDLELTLGLSPGTIDVPRADLFLSYATSLCSTIVNPVPDAANVVVVSVAARGFSNPEGVTAETVGPYTVQRGPSSLYLSRADKAALRSLGGGSGAFSIDTLPTGVNAVQLVTISGSPTGGTFTLTFFGQITIPLAFNAAALDVQNAIAALSTVGAGNVAVTGSGPYTLTFINGMGTQPLPTLIGAGSGLTGGTSPEATVTVVTIGVYKPGQGLPPWDYDYYSNRSGIGWQR